MSTRGVYKMTVDFGRMGTLESTFLASEEEIASLYGKEVDFGEALGKHSEVIFEFGEEHVRLVSDDPLFVNTFDDVEAACGYNPLEYVRESEDDDDQ